jgi:C_GCAxxG_C_C family probable redox protein
VESRVQDAVACFQEGFNCSQAVFSTYCELFGLDKYTALKIATPFGGGMRTGEVCGAVTGALMILGLKWGQHNVDDKETKENAYALAQKYMNAFKLKNESFLCRELLGIDISSDEGRKLAREKGLFNTVCPKVVRDAAQIVEKMI